MGRAPCCDKANVKRGPWSPEEDAKLKSYIDEYGTGGNWIALPRKIGLKRCGKSCRLRWLNYLRPNIKHGSFSEEEDHIICNLYLNIGSRWSIIASQLPGRTDNDIKNYWNTRLKKKLMGMQRKDQQMSKRGGKVKQEMKRQVLEDTKAPSLSTSMNLYQSFFPTELPLILTNLNHHGQELHIKPQDPIFNQYPFDTTSIQTELFDQNNKNQFPNIQYSASVDGVNVFQDFNNYPFEINEFNYNTSQLEHFDGLVLANLINGSNCTSSSGESTTSWGDHPLAYPRLSSIGYEDCQRRLLQNSPVDLPSQF